MDKNHLEGIYREEYIRAKARKDFDRDLASKTLAPKKPFIKYVLAAVSITFGFLALYTLFQINHIFN